MCAFSRKYILNYAKTAECTHTHCLVAEARKVVMVLGAHSWSSTTKIPGGLFWLNAGVFCWRGGIAIFRLGPRILSYQPGWWAIWNHKIKCLTAVWNLSPFLSSFTSYPQGHLVHEVLQRFGSYPRLQFSHTKYREYHVLKGRHWLTKKLKERQTSDWRLCLDLKSQNGKKKRSLFWMQTYIVMSATCSIGIWAIVSLSSVFWFRALNEKRKRREQNKNQNCSFMSKAFTSLFKCHSLMSSKTHPPTAWVNAMLTVAKHTWKGILLWISKETPWVIVVENQKNIHCGARPWLHPAQLFLMEVEPHRLYSSTPSNQSPKTSKRLLAPS